MDVCFRVDAGPRIGDGHWMRCLTLADELARNGAAATFVGEPGSDSLLAETAARNHRWLRMPPSEGEWTEEGDASRTLEALARNRIENDWLVVDHYDVGGAWEEKFRGRPWKLLVIDDLANREHVCDMLVDPTFAQSAARYRGLLPAGCTSLCGSEFALLRPQFGASRQHVDKVLPRCEEMRLHLFFGSVDIANHTARFSRLLLEHFSAVRIRAAVGKTYPHRGELDELAALWPQRFSWEAGILDMAAHMADCDVALGAPGGTTWERACIGLPSAYLAVAENQAMILAQLQAAGLCAYFGRAGELSDDGFKAVMKEFLSNRAQLHSMRAVGMTAVDGMGAARVAKTMASLS